LAQKLLRNKYGRLSSEQLQSWECSIKMAIADYDDRPSKRGMATQRMVHLTKTALLPLIRELNAYREATEAMATLLWQESITKSD
jgi:hypothetical protein